MALPPLWINGHPVESSSMIGGDRYHVLQFGGPVESWQKDELKSLGIRFYDYYPKYAFVVSGDSSSLAKALKKPYVVRIVPVSPEYKFSPHLKDKLLSGCYLREGDRYVARLILFNPEDFQSLVSTLKERNVEITGRDALFNRYVEVKATYSTLRELANLPTVQFVEMRHPIINWNDRKAVNHQSGLWFDVQVSSDPNDTIVWKKGIHGEGQILGHNDDGLDRDHCFFSGNVNGQPKIVDLCDYNAGGCGAASLPAGTNCNTNPGTGCHGTHTAGTAVGWSDNATAPTIPYRGLAYMARIVSQAPLGGNGGGFGQVLQDAYDRGARVHTNSWGYICPGWWGTNCAPSDYNSTAQTIDNFVWNNPDMAVVFAAGNHGDDGCASGCYRTPSDPATAKNDITVGAMGRAIDAKKSWSAYGSYPSGRFGNDIMAIGDTTYSAWGGTACDITTAWWWMGTSMATPATAGGAILIRQYYLEGWYGDGTRNSAPSHSPTAALIKASLLASAVPIAGDGDVTSGNEASASDSPVPNGNEGAGRFVLDNFMYFSPEDDWADLADSSDERKSRLWFVDNTTGLNTGDSVMYTVNVCNPHMVTRFVLAWSDYPGSTNCASGGGCLVNDLDMTVYGPAGEVFIGNATTSGADNLTPNDGTVAHDRANTWEIVRVKGITGDFIVKVKGYNVPNGPQPFALVVSGGLGPCVLGDDNELSTSERTVYTLSISPERDGIAFAVPEDEDVSVSVYTVSGRKVIHSKLRGQGKIFLKESGVYMVIVRRNGTVYRSFKVVVR